MCNTVSLLAVTNRHLSVHPYPEQIARICQTHPKGRFCGKKIWRQKVIWHLLHRCWTSVTNMMFLVFSIRSGRKRLHLAAHPSICPFLSYGGSLKRDFVFSGVCFLHGSWYFRPFRGRSQGSRIFGCYLSHCRTHLCNRL